MHSGRASSSASKAGPSTSLARKRAPSTIPNPTFPSKKSNTHLPPDMDNNMNPNTLAPQRPVLSRTSTNNATAASLVQFAHAQRPSQTQGSSSRYL
jgi:hypothetical protein